MVINASEVAGYYADSLIFGENSKYQEYSGVDMSIQDKEAYEGRIQHFIGNYSMGEYTITREEAAEAGDAFNEAIKTYAKYEMVLNKENNLWIPAKENETELSKIMQTS